MRQAARKLAAVMALTTLIGCTTQLETVTPTEPEPIVLQIHSTISTVPLLTHVSQAYQQQNPAIIIETGSGNHASLMQRLLSDEISYFISHHLPADDRLWAAPLAQDALILIVHPETSVTNLRTESLRELYQGLVKNWQAFSSVEHPVVLFSREQGSGIRLEFERQVMGQRATTSDAQIIPSATTAQTQIKEIPGSIAYLPLSLLDSDRVEVLSVNGIVPARDTISESSYPLRLTIYIIGRTPPDDRYQHFINTAQNPAFLSRSYTPLP